MRRIFKLSVLCLAAGVVTACNPEQTIETELIPTAGVRFIHAVPDTAPMDFRWVDFPENNHHFLIEYRNSVVISPTGANGVPASISVQYKGARAGSRHFRVFMNGNCSATGTCDVTYPSTVVSDQTVTLEAGKNYTALAWGYGNPTGPNRPANAQAMRVDFIEEAVTDPGAQVAIRVINATPDAIDVRFYADGSAEPATPQWANVAALTISSYQMTAPGIIWYDARPAGGAAASQLFADRRALRGEPALIAPPGPKDALPGTEVAGSAVTAIVFPRSVAGSQAPQTGASSSSPAFTAPSITFIWDRRPPRPAGT